MKNILNKILLVTLLALPATQVFGKEQVAQDVSTLKKVEKSLTDKFNQIKKQDKKALAKFTFWTILAVYLGMDSVSSEVSGIRQFISTRNPNSRAEAKYKLAWGLATGYLSLISAKLANYSLNK